MNVLIADQDADIAEAIADGLQLRAVESVIVYSGGELLQRVGELDPFDLLIADIGMPWVKARHGTRRLPVIVMSAWSDHELNDWVTQLGLGVTLLRKPFDVEALFAAIERVLPRAS